MIKAFQKEHKQVFDALKLIQQAGIRSKQSRQTLLSIKDLLVHHLAKEDKTLYPLLLASNDQTTRYTAREYIKDMQVTSRVVLAFFDKYSSDNLTASQSLDADFITDIITLMKKLQLRIAREEKFLYPLAQIEIDKK